MAHKGKVTDSPIEEADLLTMTLLSQLAGLDALDDAAVRKRARIARESLELIAKLEALGDILQHLLPGVGADGFLLFLFGLFLLIIRAIDPLEREVDRPRHGEQQ